MTLLSNCLKSYASTMIFLATWIWVLCCWVDVLSLLPSSDLYWIRWECCNKWNKSTRYKMHNILFAVVPQYYNNSGVGCIGIHLQFLDFQSSPEKKSFLLLSFSIQISFKTNASESLFVHARCLLFYSNSIFIYFLQ